MKRTIAPAMLALILSVSAAEARTICTMLADVADGRVLREDGDCRSRVTPASTFKIAIALMGFDSGILENEHKPVLEFRQGYPDWGGDNWRRPTDAERWMRYSVLWFSQEVTRKLGLERLTEYVAAFDYGNADMSGDPGKDNGLERSWISSSLAISPAEQVRFITGFVNRTLPVSQHAFSMTHNIIESRPIENGWVVHGKTGSAYPRKADGSFDRTRGYGWYVGWAAKGNRKIAFARLVQDEKREKGPGGIRARDAFMRELPALPPQ